MPITLQNKDFYFDKLSSSDYVTEQLAEEEQLDKEICQSQIDNMRADPNSKNFGQEFENFTASGVGSFKPVIVSESVNLNKSEVEVGKGVKIDNENTPFQSYFDDPSFKDIPIENVKHRSLVKNILKQGSTPKMSEILNKMSNNKLQKPTIPTNKPLNIQNVKDKQLTNIEFGLKIQFHYAAYLEYETIPFDSTQSRGEPWTEILGMQKMIPALEKSLLDMRLGEKAVVLAKYSLCFGDKGCGNRVPKNADVMFKIWLTHYTEMTLLDQFLQIPKETRVQAIKSGLFSVTRILAILADQSNVIKTDYYNKNNFSIAESRYKRLLSILTEFIPILSEKDEILINQKKLQFMKNVALCLMQRKRFKAAYEMAKESLEIEETLKAYYIMCKSLRLRDYFDDAEEMVVKMLDMSPDNPSALNERELIKRDKQRLNNALRDTYSKTFQRDDESETKTLTPRNKKYFQRSTPYNNISEQLEAEEEKFAKLESRLPEDFKNYCNTFLSTFKASTQNVIITPSDSNFSSDMIFYFAHLAENFQLDANLISNENGSNLLEFKKL